MKAIENSKLSLKPFDKNHVADFVKAVRESADTVGMWMSWCHAEYPEKEALSWFKACQNNIDNESAYDIGVFLIENDRLVGGISINEINRQNNIGNIGYWTRESFQHQGIASSAVELIKTFGFDTLGLTRLEIVILEDNIISRKVAEKSGAKFECIAQNRLIHNGQAMAAAVYSLVPE
ncbi:GNAT family N-acetyltransferase [bacterium AH-315-E07]|nr:GNAT family N-acetyltransferase [bacterium AH-315-E07]